MIKCPQRQERESPEDGFGMKKICVTLVCCLISAAFAAGCGYREQVQIEETPSAAPSAMESEPVADYEVPQMTANILVDLQGYSASASKCAWVKGKKLPDSFRLVDASEKETVFEGTIEDVTYDEKSGLYLGTADFSEYTLEGKYYLACDFIGRSFPFELREKNYKEMFAEICSSMTEQCMDGSLQVEDAITLLETYEWYDDLFTQDGGDVPDVLNALKAWVTSREAKGTDAEETVLYAAFLAKFSYNYQNYDRQYATDCLKRASTVYGQAKDKTSPDPDMFFALTELYRATGLNTYGKQITDYRDFFESDSGYPAQTGYLYGIMTYMSTRQKIDMELCETFMMRLMDRAEEISLSYEDRLNLSKSPEECASDLLRQAVEVSCANYVMNIYQYTNIVEGLLHYLMGKNPVSVSFYDCAKDRAGYLLPLAQLAAHGQ